MALTDTQRMDMNSVLPFTPTWNFMKSWDRWSLLKEMESTFRTNRAINISRHYLVCFVRRWVFPSSVWPTLPMPR